MSNNTSKHQYPSKQQSTQANRPVSPPPKKIEEGYQPDTATTTQPPNTGKGMPTIPTEE
jgi:hypothetical protein